MELDDLKKEVEALRVQKAEIIAEYGRQYAELDAKTKSTQVALTEAENARVRAVRDAEIALTEAQDSSKRAAELVANAKIEADRIVAQAKERTDAETEKIVALRGEIESVLESERAKESQLNAGLDELARKMQEAEEFRASAVKHAADFEALKAAASDDRAEAERIITEARATAETIRAATDEMLKEAETMKKIAAEKLANAETAVAMAAELSAKTRAESESLTKYRDQLTAEIAVIRAEAVSARDSAVAQNAQNIQRSSELKLLAESLENRRLVIEKKIKDYKEMTK